MRKTLVLLLTICSCLAAAEHVGIDERGFLAIDGERCFPLGLRHGDPARYGSTLIEDVYRIGDAGFDLLQVALDFTRDQPSTAETVHNAAGDRGMLLIVEPPLGDLELAGSFHARRPGVLATSLGDGINRGALAGDDRPRMSAVALRALRERLLRSSRGQLAQIGLSGDPRHELAGYADSVDVVSLQLDQIGDGALDPASALERQQDLLWRYRQSDAFSPCLLAGIPVIPRPGGRWPAAAELRAQAWICPVAGAKGIVWSVFSDGIQVLPDVRPDIWGELVKLTGELKQVRELLTDGRRQPVVIERDPQFADGGGAWHACWWMARRRSLLVVVNTDRERAFEIDLRSPREDGMSLRTLLPVERYPDCLALRNGRVVGSVPPLGVACYSLE